MATMPCRFLVLVLLFLCAVGHARQNDGQKNAQAALFRVKRRGPAAEQSLQLHLAENQDGSLGGEKSLVRVKRMRRNSGKPEEETTQTEEIAKPEIRSSDKDSGRAADDLSHFTRETNARNGRLHHERDGELAHLEGKHKAHSARSHKSPENHRPSKHQEGKHAAHAQRKALQKHSLEQELKDLKNLRRDVNQDLDLQIKKLRSERKPKRTSSHKIKAGKKNTHKKH